MNGLLALLTSRKTTLIAVLAGLGMFFADKEVVATLIDLGISGAVSAWLVSASKLVTLALAALGYSPLKRPDPTTNGGTNS